MLIIYIYIYLYRPISTIYRYTYTMARFRHTCASKVHAGVHCGGRAPTCRCLACIITCFPYTRFGSMVRSMYKVPTIPKFTMGMQLPATSCKQGKSWKPTAPVHWICVWRSWQHCHLPASSEAKVQCLLVPRGLPQSPSQT